MQRLQRLPSHILLILKNGSQIELESNVCLVGKVTCHLKLTLLLRFNELKWANNLNLKCNLTNLIFKLK